MTAPLLRTRASLAREVTDLREQLAAAHERLRLDPLTGLLNRDGLAAAYAAGGWGALLLLDLDGFKPINDQHGHAAGDEVLRVIAARLVRPGRATARLGGDEYAVLLPARGHLAPGIAAQVIAEVIAGAIWLDDAHHVAVTASVGVRILRPSDQLQQVLADADTAMYQAKTQSRGVAVWQPGLTRPDVTGGRLRDVRRDAPRDDLCPWCGGDRRPHHTCPGAAGAAAEIAAVDREVRLHIRGAS